MDFGLYLWTTLGAFLTLAIFSFLYKDNPFYKIAEHLVVGVSAGYFAVILWHNGLSPNLFQRLNDGNWYFLWMDSTAPWYLIPAILGIMMYTRFSKKWAWVSRWPMALYIGIATGVAIPLEMGARVNRQLFAIMERSIDWANFFGVGGFNLLDTASGLSQLIVFVGAMAALIYFFFSKEHTGLFGATAKFGIWILMIGFGASFGYTVMARISLFINRIQYIDNNWLQNGLNTGITPIEGYHAGYAVIFWLVVLIVVGYIIREIMTYLKTKEKSA
ncbi:MAG: hypothetical protein P1R58_06795 [bacterium]|nr:hypothetical protein [bacterium]